MSRLARQIMIALGAASLAACHGSGEEPSKAEGAKPTEDAVELTPTQLKTVSLGTITLHTFSPERSAVGNVDFDQNRQVQVFSNYQGRILKTFADLGDPVAKGQPLFTVESPDLQQAESSLIQAAGVYELTTRALERDKKIHQSQGIADKDLDQAISDQMAADGALKAARGQVRNFGKTDKEIDQIVRERRIDPALVVRSPLTGRVTARNAQEGLLVQPGVAPAPYAVADLSTLWLMAYVPEADAALFHRGQSVSVSVEAYPGEIFSGQVSAVGVSVDPGAHTETVRTEIKDPSHKLRPGMLATFVLHTGATVQGLAIPSDGVVRNGDGSMNVWVTHDDRRFARHTVKLGLQQDGLNQVLEGVAAGDRVVTKGAIFLSNMANAAASGDD